MLRGQGQIFLLAVSEREIANDRKEAVASILPQTPSYSSALRCASMSAIISSL